MSNFQFKRRKLGDFSDSDSEIETKKKKEPSYYRKVEDIEDSDDELINDIVQSMEPINKHDPEYFARSLPEQKRTEFIGEFQRRKSLYGSIIQGYKNQIRELESKIFSLKKEIIRAEKTEQQVLDQLKEEFRKDNSNVTKIPYLNQSFTINVVAKISHLDTNGNVYYNINRNQSSVDVSGDNSCTCISVVCCTSFLTTGKKVIEMDWWYIIKTGAFIHKEAISVTQKARDTTEQFQSSIDVFKHVSYFEPKKKFIDIAVEYGGYLNEEDQKDVPDSEKELIVDFKKAIDEIDNKIKRKIAVSVTIGDYTITILTLKDHEWWYLYDSHDYIDNEGYSKLIGFVNKKELCNYVLKTYNKVDFKRGPVKTCYSLVVFINKEER